VTANTASADTCLTCYGAGETVSEDGPQTCTDCFGEGRALRQAAKLEWRLREIERAAASADREAAAELLWLVHEVRRGREALTRILARCQDAGDREPLAHDVTFEANEALGLYPPG
jgi:hypothetical protein